jgi:hypothetical protein
VIEAGLRLRKELGGYEWLLPTCPG